MTNEEAVKVLEDMKVKIAIPKAAELQRKRNEAIAMAIEALNSTEIPNNSDTVYRKQAIDALKELTANGTNKGMVFGKDAVHRIEMLQPAQQSLSEEYAKAVRNWLVNYQIKCAELKGRYTPYEVLGWIVSDWRKENGIW